MLVLLRVTERTEWVCPLLLTTRMSEELEWRLIIVEGVSKC